MGLFSLVTGFLGWIVAVVEGLFATVAGFLGWLAVELDVLGLEVPVVAGFVVSVNGFGK